MSSTAFCQLAATPAGGSIPHDLTVDHDRTTETFPEALYRQGITDLVSVIPPGATLAPSSKIPWQHLGKVPGRRLPSGLWAGYDWRKSEPCIDDVRGWAAHGANVGVRGDRFPAVDIDCPDAALAEIIERVAREMLGPAPVRTGKAPKRLLMYRAAEPFGRMRLWLTYNGTPQLVEILGQGQQYLVYGTHPSTLQPYAWNAGVAALRADGLTVITREQATAFFDYLAEALEVVGVTRAEREGDGRPVTRRAAADQSALVAPSLDALHEAVAVIPNTNELDTM